MAASPQQQQPRRRGSVDETSFTRNMRYEFADAEGRAIMWSYIVSSGLGLLWLLLVWFGPTLKNSITLLPTDQLPVDVTVTDVPLPTPTVTPAPAGNPAGPKPAPGGGKSAGDQAAKQQKAIEGAFGGPSNNTGAMVGDVSNALRGVDVRSASGATPGAQGKAVIGYGAGGQGSRTPGRGGLGEGLGTGTAGGLGGVGGGGGVGFAVVAVAPPSVIHADKIGGPGRNVSDLGDYVRSRNSQLQFCYQEYGLKANPSLAGTVSAAITMTGAGSVTGVDITRRTWSGPGASEAEGCIRQRIAGWRFPPSEQGGGTYSFSFSFSR